LFISKSFLFTPTEGFYIALHKLTQSISKTAI
jgi:hypothetical protein